MIAEDETEELKLKLQILKINNKIIITECPRDAMQGIDNFIPTIQKANYINSLINVGFDSIDFGSFVSKRRVPQMSDTAEVLDLLEIKKSTNLLSIVVNSRGASDATSYEKISTVGYPLSISEQFQLNNTKMKIQESLTLVDEIFNKCLQKNKNFQVYFSMAFGNPYNETWNIDILLNLIHKISEKGIKLISLADTVGIATNKELEDTLKIVLSEFQEMDIGLHLHSNPNASLSKVKSAWNAGCNRFDSAIGGYGGCPFTKNKLIGNLDTKTLINFINENNINNSIDVLSFENAVNKSKMLFN